MLTRFKNFDVSHLVHFASNSRRLLVSIHFLPSKIRLVKAVFENDEQEILDMQTLSLPNDLAKCAWIDAPEKLAEFIKNNMECRSLSGLDAIAVVDTGLTCIKELNMPVLSEQELEQAIKWDALQYLPYNDGEYVYGYNAYPWSNSYGEGIKINLIATESRISTAIVAACTRLKLYLRKITVAALALKETVPPQYVNYAVLDIEDDSTQVTVYEENRPVQNATIDTGFADVVSAVATHLHMSTAQAKALLADDADLAQVLETHSELSERIDTLINDLLNKASMSIEQYLFDKPGQLMEVVLIVGSLLGLNGRLKKCIHVQLGIYAEQTAPEQGWYFADNININLRKEEFCAAIGAVKLLRDNAKFSLVRLTPGLGYGHKAVRLTSAICIGLFACLLVYETTLLYASKNDYKALSKDYEQITVWRKRSEFVSKLEADCARREQTIAKLRIDSTAWPQVLLALGYNIPDNVSILSIVKVRDEDHYILRGKTEQIANLKQFIYNIQQTNAFKSVTLQQVSEGVVANAHQEFTISLKGMGKNHAEDNAENSSTMERK